MKTQITQDTSSERAQVITREQLGMIKDVACFVWRAKLTEYANKDPFSSTVTFTDEQVAAMFTASSLTQKEVLIKAGLVLPVEDKNPFLLGLADNVLEEISETLLGSNNLQITSSCNYQAPVELRGRSLWVSDNYKVILHHECECGTVIELKKKN